MSGKLYGSLREEALEIAIQTRRDILSEKANPATVLRACLLIANDLGKTSALEWINLELSGYGKNRFQIIELQTAQCLAEFIEIFLKSLIIVSSTTQFTIFYLIQRGIAR